MINFLRKYTDRSSINWLKYGLETIAVIFGILIALAVDNWNEERRIDNLEIQILAEIKNGLSNDLNDVNVNLSWHKSILENQTIFIKWLESDLDFNDSLLHPITYSFLGSSFLISEGPYETLKEFGLNRISNNSLKNKIVDLYETEYHRYTFHHEIYITELKKVLDQGINYFNEYPFATGDIMEPINIMDMKDDHAFLFRLKTLKNINKAIIDRNIDMKSKLENTIESIEDELQ